MPGTSAGMLQRLWQQQSSNGSCTSQTAIVQIAQAFRASSLVGASLTPQRCSKNHLASTDDKLHCTCPTCQMEIGNSSMYMSAGNTAPRADNVSLGSAAEGTPLASVHASWPHGNGSPLNAPATAVSPAVPQLSLPWSQGKSWSTKPPCEDAAVSLMDSVSTAGTSLPISSAAIVAPTTAAPGQSVMSKQNSSWAAGSIGLGGVIGRHASTLGAGSLLTAGGLVQPSLLQPMAASPAVFVQWRGFAAAAESKTATAGAGPSPGGKDKEDKASSEGVNKDASKGKAASSEALQQVNAAKDVQSLCSAIDAHGESFDDETLVAALLKVSDLAAADKSGKALEEKSVQTLLSMLMLGAERLPPKSLAQVAKALGTLGVKDELVLDEVGRAMMGVLPELGAQELAQLAEGLAATGHSPSIVLLDAIKERSQQLAKDGGGDAKKHSETAEQALKGLGHGQEVDVKPNPPQQKQNDRAGKMDYA